jgi:NAD(P)-dependent dehydrogenase (short-subunit alcohol dehydrogenase family)
VTGASSGIGLATARLFADRGARVFGTSRRDRDGPDGVRMVRLDVGSDESVQRCIDEIVSRAGHLDVLVNNAGVMHEGIAEETKPADAEAVFDVNFFGADRVIRAVLPGMRARRCGRIINVGSLAAWIGEPGEAFYAASKAALARYTESLRHEVRHLGVHVCLVEPGVVATGVLNAGTTSRPTFADYEGPREAARRTLHAALYRGADPDRVAGLIVKIADAARPRYRYSLGVGAGLPLLKTLLPQRVFEFILRRSYRLPTLSP